MKRRSKLGCALGLSLLTACGGDKAAAPAGSAAPIATAAPTSTSVAAATMSGQEMATEAHKAGRPLVPAGWKGKPQDKVLKEISDWGIYDMYVITRLDGGKAYVKYCGTGDEQKDPMSLDAVAPIPGKDSTEMPAPGSYVIIPDKNAESCKWKYARVKKVDGQNVTVETVNFQKREEKTAIEERMVRPGELVQVK